MPYCASKYRTYITSAPNATSGTAYASIAKPRTAPPVDAATVVDVDPRPALPVTLADPELPAIDPEALAPDAVDVAVVTAVLSGPIVPVAPLGPALPESPGMVPEAPLGPAQPERPPAIVPQALHNCQYSI